MGRRHSDPKVRNGRKNKKSERSKKKNSGRRNDSDNSSVSSYPEEFSGDEYKNRDSQNSKNKFEVNDWSSDDDHSEYTSDSDSSYNPTNQKIRNKAYRERQRSRGGSPSHSRYSDSDSDESDSSSFNKRTSSRSGNISSRYVSGKGSKSRKEYSSRSSDDKNSDNRSNFISRIDRIRREDDDSSFNYDDDSKSDSHSSESVRDSHKLRRSGSNSNLHKVSHRSLLSHQQSTRSMGQQPSTLNPSFRGQEQIMQMSIPPRNPPLIRSASARSLGGTVQTFFPGQQYPKSGVLINQPFVNQGQQSTEIPGRNVGGTQNPRISVGPGHMMRSMSGRSINSYSLGQVQFNRPSQGVNVQSPIEMSPHTEMKNSQISQGNKSGAYNGNLRNVLSHSPVYLQQSGVMNTSSNGNMGNNDVRLKTRMCFEQPGLIRLGFQNDLINNKPLNSQGPELMRVSSQRSLGNINALLNTPSMQSNPNVRMDSTQQPLVRMNNLNMDINRTSCSSTDSVLVMSGASENVSLLSSKSRRSEPQETLADQIYSRSQNRLEDTQSFGTIDDPPVEDCNRWDRDEIYSDDSSYDSFRDSRKSSVDDPPDMFDDDQSYSDVSRDESKRDKYDESFRSTDDEQNFYDEEDSNVSGFNEDSLGSMSDDSSRSFRGQKYGKRTGKSPPGFSCDYGEEADPSENDVYSKKRDIDKKKRIDDVATATRRSSMSWLAQQISIRKSIDTNAGSRNLEPEGTSTIGRKEFSLKDPEASDAGGILNMLKDNDELTREEKPELGYILKHKVGDTVLHSVKVGILRSDDSTTTTDTMTREVPSVILSIKDDAYDSFSDSNSNSNSDSDSDSSRSIRYDESVQGRSATYNCEKMRSDSSFCSRKEKSAPKASGKKCHIDTPKRAGKRVQETRSKKNPSDYDVSSKVRKRIEQDTLDGKGSKKKNSSLKAKSLRKKKSNRTDDGNCRRATIPREIERPQTSTKTNVQSSRISGTRKSEKTRNASSNREIDEVQSFEDRHSVMGLIDQLKAFECQE